MFNPESKGSIETSSKYIKEKLWYNAPYFLYLNRIYTSTRPVYKLCPTLENSLNINARPIRKY